VALHFAGPFFYARKNKTIMGCIGLLQKEFIDRIKTFCLIFSQKS
jgi:hypothetical protein